MMVMVMVNWFNMHTDNNLLQYSPDWVWHINGDSHYDVCPEGALPNTKVMREELRLSFSMFSVGELIYVKEVMAVV